MPWVQQGLLIRSQELGPLSEPEYQEALKEMLRLSREEGIDAVMAEQDLDAIVAPTEGPAWTTDLINGDRFIMGSSSPAAIAGYPSITVPMGFFTELPVNVSFWGRAWSEPELMAMAFAFETETRHRRPPRFIPTLDIGGVPEMG